jgi:hypothetical protein
VRDCTSPLLPTCSQLGANVHQLEARFPDAHDVRAISLDLSLIAIDLPWPDRTQQDQERAAGLFFSLRRELLAGRRNVSRRKIRIQRSSPGVSGW